MSEDIVAVLDALGEDDFYYRPATTKATIDKAAAEITRLRAELATALREVEQERDEFFNRLGRITEYLDLPVDATAQRIIEAIQERVDSEREACASVEVRLVVPEGAETWTPLEAWEEALIAFDEAFRDAIRAAAPDERPSEEIIREDRDAWPDHQANDPIRAAAKEGNQL